MQLKSNPFTPQEPIINPEKFAGRGEPIKNAVDAIFNNKNIIITGERGIGKSSLAYQLINLAEGEKVLLTKLEIETNDFEFSYLIADHRCVPGNTLADILNSLQASLYRQLEKKVHNTKKTTQWGIDFKIFNFAQKQESENPDVSEMVSKFVNLVDNVLDGRSGDYNGICFLIDEIDVLPIEIQIAPFFKASSESLRFKGYNNISFIVAGVTGTMTNLITQHKSFTRLFENIELRRMNFLELEEIIVNALRGTGVGIRDDIKKQIIKFADRFPEPVHLLGYHTFRFDNNSVLEKDDFNKALNFIVKELKNQEFGDLYIKAGSGLPEAIIHFMANSYLSEVAVSDAAKIIGASEHAVGSDMGRLAASSIIMKVKGNRYKFQDPLFKIYLRWTL